MLEGPVCVLQVALVLEAGFVEGQLNFSAVIASVEWLMQVDGRRHGRYDVAVRSILGESSPAGSGFRWDGSSTPCRTKALATHSAHIPAASMQQLHGTQCMHASRHPADPPTSFLRVCAPPGAAAHFVVAAFGCAGKKHGLFMVIVQHSNLLLANIGFQIAAADACSTIAATICKAQHTPEGQCWNNQPVLTVLIGVVQLLLSQMRNLQAARVSSAVGGVAAVVYCAIMFGLAGSRVSAAGWLAVQEGGCGSCCAHVLLDPVRACC